MPGLVLVAGGKYTTYRVMAEDAVDAAVAGFPAVPASRTAHLPLVGAQRWADVRDIGGGARGRRPGCPRRPSPGCCAGTATRSARSSPWPAPTPRWPGPLDGAPAYLAAEVVHAVRAEGALHLDDVLTRRTRVSIQTAHRGVDSAPQVAALMARELGWDEERTAREVAHYAARVDAERESQRMPDDHTADAARLGAPDVRAAV